MDPVDALVRLGGIAPATHVVAVSSRRRLRTALGRGEIVRVSRNRLALPTAERGADAARAYDGYLSHLSAAAHHGWKITLPPDLPQITLPRGRQLPKELPVLADIHQRTLPVAERDGWATSKLRTVLDCARELSFGDALTVADSALRGGDLEYDELNQAAAGLTGPGADHARLVARYADERAANPFESVLRSLAILAGLDVVPQYETLCGDRLYHPDLADPVRGIVLEADSWTWHAEKWDHDRDCSRYNAMTVAGWRVLRFTYEHVMHAPEYVTTTIRGLMS